MRNIVITFIFLVVSLLSLTFFVGNEKNASMPQLARITPHMFNNKNDSIQNINLTVFYFIPKDAVVRKDIDWKGNIETHIQELINFHNVQFHNTSKISYTFYPEIIIGNKTTKEYEGFFEGGENDALLPIKDEIVSRAVDTKGQSYYESMTKGKAKDTRNSYMVIFEGKGAAGNDDFALVSHAYLVNNQYKESGSTFLAHEFYHTLGLLDNYESSVYVFKDGQQRPISLVTNKDIMGQVNVPLSYTYIDMATLKKMGF